MTVLSSESFDRISALLECAEWGHDWEFQDDSFDHEFGTERVHYWLCPTCECTRSMEPGDFADDDHYYEDQPTWTS